MGLVSHEILCLEVYYALQAVKSKQQEMSFHSLQTLPFPGLWNVGWWYIVIPWTLEMELGWWPGGGGGVYAANYSIACLISSSNEHSENVKKMRKLIVLFGYCSNLLNSKTRGLPFEEPVLTFPQQGFFFNMLAHSIFSNISYQFILFYDLIYM